MKTFLTIILLTPALFLFYGCEDDDEPVNTGEENIKIYYTYQDEAKQLASDGDTIAVNLGDTLYVSVEIVEDDAFSSVSVSIYNLETEETGDYEYSCVAKEAGIAFITAFAKNSELSDLADYLYVNVTSSSYLLLIVGDPSFTIDVEDESLKAKIKEELEDTYAVIFYDFYTLTCNTATGGDLQLVTAQNDTISGSFTSSDIFTLSDLTMSYDNSSYSFTVEQKETDSDYYYLTQDLTEEFRAQYPSETINEVTITTLALMNKGE